MAKPFRKKGSRNYYAEIWSHGRRRTISLRTDNYGIARTLAGKLEHEARTTGFDRPTRTPIGLLVQRFIEHMRIHQRPKAVQTDAYRLREFFGPVCDALQKGSPVRRGSVIDERPRGRRRRTGRACKEYAFAVKLRFVEEVTTSLVIEFLTKLPQQRSIGPKTWNEYRGMLHRFIAWAAKTQGVNLPALKNPVADVPRRHVDPPTIRFLTIPQVREQLKALSQRPQLQVMVAVLIYAGLRREELLWLTHNDVDLDRRVVHVRAKSVNGRYWKPKTSRSRKVPISQALMRYLHVYALPSNGPWFFPSPLGCRWDADNFGHALSDENARHGLRWNCLAYRHTFGTQLAMAGRDERTIAELMGNSPTIVRRHYAAWLPEAHPEAVEFDCPQGPAQMENAAGANVRVEAHRRGLRLITPCPERAEGAAW